MDRNLGASQVATSMTDALAYGDLYQWGRLADGHQCRNSATTTIMSSTDQPGNSDFVLTSAMPFDWRNPQNANLWQGVNGINNPCPSGYRIPTYTELNEERGSWTSSNNFGAFASACKFPLGGVRLFDEGGAVNGEGQWGAYWSSTPLGTSIQSEYLQISTDAIMIGSVRGNGYSVRCIKD